MTDRIAKTLTMLLGPCRCIVAYRDRGLRDPQCVRCDQEADAREYIENREREIAALRSEVDECRAAIHENFHRIAELLAEVARLKEKAE